MKTLGEITMPAEDTPLQDVTPPVSFACPDCGKTLKARMELAGKKVKCTQCGSAVPAPPLTDPDREEIWKTLASDEAKPAQQAMGRLVRAPEQAVPWLAEQLKSEPKQVRYAVCEWWKRWS